MKKGVLPKSSRLSRTFGRIGALLLSLVLLAVFQWGILGCGEEDPPVYPTRPEPQTPNWFFDVWGDTLTNDVFVVGQPGLILHYDGANWTKMSMPSGVGSKSITSIFGYNRNDVYACGHNGLILHYNGSSWSKMSSGTDEDLFSIAPYLDGSLYCCGANGALRRLSGSSWVTTPRLIYRWNTTGTATIDTLDRAEDIESFTVITKYGIGGDRGRIVMDNTTAGSWQYKLVADEEWVLTAWSGAEINGNFVVTEEGRLYQLNYEVANDQFAWGELSSPSRFTAIYDMWSADLDTFYFVSQTGDVIRRDLASESIEIVFDGVFWLYGVWGTSNSDIWAVGINETIVHFDGDDWSLVDTGLALPKSGYHTYTDKFGRPQ